MKGSPVYFDFDKEMEQVAIFLTAESDLLADRLELRIRQMMNAGMSKGAIVAALRRDLRAGGPIFSGFASTFKRHVFPVVDNFAQGAIVEENPDAMVWEWITTSADPCDDCRPRHGLRKAYREWESVGLPRSGFSVCGDNCKCALVPSNMVGNSIAKNPVIVPTLAQARATFQEELRTNATLKGRMDAYRDSMRARKKSGLQ